jgi:Na+/proline symporter
MFGGVQAVTWADVKQMVLIVFALVAIVIVLLIKIPVSPSDAFELAGATGRLTVFDFSWDITKTYTFWSGILGGTFLMLSYFGTDQSQVQRYLTAKSVDDARTSLLMSAYWKIPLQALVLIVGILVWVFYLFTGGPLLWNPAAEKQVIAAEPAAYQELQVRYGAAIQERNQDASFAVSGEHGVGADRTLPDRAALVASEAKVNAIRGEAQALVSKVTGAPARDVNYIIPHFVLHFLPLGLAGLFIAGVMAAAMSSIAAELNSLSTATVIDFYRRWWRPDGGEVELLRVSKLSTGLWGLFACVVATYAANLGSLIEVVNRFGSFFYGSILGVFLLAMLPRTSGAGAFFGLLAGMGAVAAVSFGMPEVSFLWHNVVGAVTVLVVGFVLSVVMPRRPMDGPPVGEFG